MTVESTSGWIVSHRDRGGAPIRLPAATSAASPEIGPADRAGGGQGRRLDGRGGGDRLSDGCRDRLTGIAVARQGYGRPTRSIPMIEAGPPDPRRGRARKRPNGRSNWPSSAGADDLVLVLLSGGASANWIAPARGLSLADKQAVTRALLRSGANIGEINTVRKHLSRIKGGRLARMAQPARACAHARDFRCARRRSGGDRLGSDRARSDDARRCSRHRRALQARCSGGRDARADRSGQRIAQARRPGFRRDRVQTDRPPGRRLPRRGARSRGCSATSRVMLGDTYRGRSARSCRRTRRSRAGAASTRDAARSSSPAAN